MKFLASFDDLKRRCSIRRKKGFQKRTTSALFLFKDDNLPVTFTPIKTTAAEKRCACFRSTPNLPKTKKSVSFDTSNQSKMSKTATSLNFSRQVSFLNVTRHSSPLYMSPRNIPRHSSSLNVTSRSSSTHSSPLNMSSRNISRISQNFELSLPNSPRPIKQTSLNLVVDTSSCAIVLGLDLLENDKCSSFACCDDVCLVCSMIRPELRGPHFPGNLSPEALRTFF